MTNRQWSVKEKAVNRHPLVVGVALALIASLSQGCLTLWASRPGRKGPEQVVARRPSSSQAGSVLEPQAGELSVVQRGKEIGLTLPIREAHLCREEEQVEYKRSAPWPDSTNMIAIGEAIVAGMGLLIGVFKCKGEDDIRVPAFCEKDGSINSSTRQISIALGVDAGLALWIANYRDSKTKRKWKVGEGVSRCGDDSFDRGRIRVSTEGANWTAEGNTDDRGVLYVSLSDFPFEVATSGSVDLRLSAVSGERIAPERVALSAPDRQQLVELMQGRISPPRLVATTLLKDENGDQELTSGESASLQVSVTNTGGITAREVVVRLSSEDPLMEAFSAREVPLPPIEPRGSGEAVFHIVVPRTIETGNLDLVVEAIDGQYPLAAAHERTVIAKRHVASSPRVISRIIDVDLPIDKPSEERPEDLAIVVGVSEYRDLDKSSWPRFAKQDATMFGRYAEKALGVPRARILLLVDTQATKGDIESAILDWLPGKVKPGSRVYFYFAGHGTAEAGTGGALLLPYDGSPSFRSRMLLANDVYRWLSAAGAESVLVVLDACFSGSGGRSVPPGGRANVVPAGAFVAPDGVMVLAASGEKEIAWDYEAMEHGLFTYFVLKGLRGAADSNGDRTIRLSELYEYVRANVPAIAMEQKGQEQRPVLNPPPTQMREEFDLEFTPPGS